MEQSEFVQRQVAEIDRRLQEIDEVLAGREALVQERHRLQAARAALAGNDAPTQATDGARGTPGSRPRAARGENRRRLLEAVRERPGASVGELAEVSKVAQPTAYNALRQMLKAGEVERVDLGGGKSGYRPAQPSDSTQSEPVVG
jgi:hypothetical protein